MKIHIRIDGWGTTLAELKPGETIESVTSELEAKYGQGKVFVRERKTRPLSDTEEAAQRADIRREERERQAEYDNS